MQGTEARQESGTVRERADTLARGSLPQRRWLDVQEAAEHIRSTVGGVYNKVHRREIPFVKLGRRVLFDVRDLDAYMERNKVYPKEQPFPAVPRAEPQIKVVKGGIFDP